MLTNQLLKIFVTVLSSASTYIDSNSGTDSKSLLQSFLSFFSVLPRPPIQHTYIHTQTQTQNEKSAAPATMAGYKKSVYYTEAPKSRLAQTIIYTYIHTHKYILIHAYIHTYIHTYNAVKSKKR